MKLPDGGKLGLESSSVLLLARFFAGRARDVLRNSRNEVLPAFWVPMMRMLKSISLVTPFLTHLDWLFRLT